MKTSWPVQELPIPNMLQIEASRDMLSMKGIIKKDEFIAKFEKLDTEMKGQTGKKYFKMYQAIWARCQWVKI